MLWLFSTEPAANGLMTLGEASARKTLRLGVPYDAVIILGGAFDPEASHLSGRPEFTGAIERLLAGFELLKSGVARNALLSGGLLEPDEALMPEAIALKAQLERFGIASNRLVVEPDSRNTHENAAFSRKLVDSHRWRRLLLVTSAIHMQRAAACFAAEGMTVDTFPVDVRSARLKWRAGGLLPRAAHLEQSTDVLRELAGRWVYQVRGYTLP